jgi:hypothetical protein
VFEDLTTTGSIAFRIIPGFGDVQRQIEFPARENNRRRALMIGFFEGRWHLPVIELKQAA